MTRVLLLSAMVTSSLGFAVVPATAPSAALAGRTHPAPRGGPLSAHDVAARISPPRPSSGGCRRPARDLGSGAWTQSYPVVLESLHVSLSFCFCAASREGIFGERRVFSGGWVAPFRVAPNYSLCAWKKKIREHVEY